MPQTAPLHYGVHYFRLAHQYHSEGEREVFLNRYKEPLLTLAESLFANGHLIEAWFYYYELNKIMPIEGKHKTLSQLANSYRLKQVKLDELKKAHLEYPSEVGVAYGIILLEKIKSKEPGQSNIKEEIKKILESLPAGSYGKCHLTLRKKIAEGRENSSTSQEEENIFKKFGFETPNHPAFQALLEEQNHICLRILIFDIRNFLEKLDEQLNQLKELIENKAKSEEIDHLFELPYSKEDEETLMDLFFKAQFSRKYLMIEESVQEEPMIFINEGEEFTKALINLESRQGRRRPVNSNSESKVTPIDLELETFINNISTTYPLKTRQSEINACINQIKNLLTQGKETLRNILNVDPYHYGALWRSFQLKEREALRDTFVRIINLLESDYLLRDFHDLQKESLKRALLQSTTVFISYSRKDKMKMEMLREKLKSAGISIKIDESDIKLSPEELERQIEILLSQCDFVISLISKHSLRSEWVAFESIFTFGEEKFIKKDKFLPLVLDKEVRSTGFRTTIREKISEEISELEKIRKREIEKNPEPPEDIDKRIKRKAKLYNNFPQIYSRLTEKFILDYDSPKEIKENFPEILTYLIEKRNNVNDQ